MSTVEERREELAKRKPTVVIDWDGTLVEQKWPEMGDWLPGAVEAVEDFLNAGYHVIVHSSRTHSQDLDGTKRTDWQVQGELDAIRTMLDLADLEIVEVYTSDKPPADAYIDDKALRFNGDWEGTVESVLMGRDPAPHGYTVKDPTLAEGEELYEKAGRPNLKALVNRDPGDETPTFKEMMERAPTPALDRLDQETIRVFETGATRNLDAGKHDYAKYLSPLVLRRFGEYMAKNAVQADGSIREGDNWKKGIPLDSFLSSGWRHLLDWWLEHDGFESREGLEDALCGLLFNAMGYLHETLKEQA